MSAGIGESYNEQLQMQWPHGLLGAPPVPQLPPGYNLRCYMDADAAGYIELMARAGFDGWTGERIAGVRQKILPGGFFLIVHPITGALAATAMSTHNPTTRYPGGSETGWVAADPAHRGKGLGMAVTAAATARAIAAGYSTIYLLTDDFRLPAIKTYLKLGYEPVVFSEEIADRWKKIIEQLQWPHPIPEVAGFKN